MLLVTHHSDFTSELCSETWNVENGVLSTTGTAWLAEKLLEKEAVDEVVDGAGNVIKIKKKLTGKELRKKNKERFVSRAAAPAARRLLPRLFATFSSSPLPPRAARSAARRARRTSPPTKKRAEQAAEWRRSLRNDKQTTEHTNSNNITPTACTCRRPCTGFPRTHTNQNL